MIRILVPLDGSQLAEQALTHAVAIARSFKTEVSLLQVISDSQKSGDVVLESADRRLQAAQAKSYLDEIAKRMQQQDVAVSTAVAMGRPADEIVAYAQAKQIDLITLTAFGQGGTTEFVHGSTVHKIISAAGRSILLVRPNDHSGPEIRYRKLLVPLDGSYRTDWALCLATSIARAHQAELMLMQVVEVPKTPRRMPLGRTERELVERLVDIHKRDAEHHLRELTTQLPSDVKHSTQVIVAEEVAQVIEKMAQTEDVGLLVLAAHGLSATDYWLYGAVSETMLAHSTRPVLVLQDNLTSDKVEFKPEPLAANG